MSWSDETLAIIERLHQAGDNLKQRFSGREQAIELLRLAVICQEHLLLLGPPGTGKSELVLRFADLIDARSFKYLLTRFTEPAEIFGPLDIELFRQGKMHIRTDNMLPMAHIAFLDEVFQGSSAILNTLLTLIHERVFHNGPERQPAPLMSVLGASNSLPEDATLHAFSDRFVLRLNVAPGSDDTLTDLLDKGWALEVERVETTIDLLEGRPSRQAPHVTPEELRRLHLQLGRVDLEPIRQVYAQMVREIHAEGIDLSDRRLVKGLKLVAGACMLDRRNTAELKDLWPLNHIWGRPEEAEHLQKVVQQRVEEGGGPTLHRHRSTDSIVAELATLQGQELTLSGEVALGAHLMALGRLRREILVHHAGNPELRRGTEEAIARLLSRMEGHHV